MTDAIAAWQQTREPGAVETRHDTTPRRRDDDRSLARPQVGLAGVLPACRRTMLAACASRERKPVISGRWRRP